jgi:hypothetical protein
MASACARGTSGISLIRDVLSTAGIGKQKLRSYGSGPYGSAGGRDGDGGWYRLTNAMKKVCTSDRLR